MPQQSLAEIFIRKRWTVLRHASWPRIALGVVIGVLVGIGIAVGFRLASSIRAVTLDWTAVTAIGTLALALVGFWAIRAEAERVRKAAGLDTFWHLLAMWDSTEMQRKRCLSARWRNQAPPTTTSIPRPALDVLNFFESLGGLVTTEKALRVQVAWDQFSPFADAYWERFSRFITWRREGEGDEPGDLTEFKEYARLISLFAKYEARMGLRTLSPEEKATFAANVFDAESRLGLPMRDELEQLAGRLRAARRAEPQQPRRE